MSAFTLIVLKYFPLCVHTRIYVCTDISVGQPCILYLSSTQWFLLINREFESNIHSGMPSVSH